MSFYDYVQGVPAANDNPSDDQPNMLINTNSSYSIWDIDHHGFQDNLGGYHTVIHQDKQTSCPSAIPGINQIFAGDPAVIVNPQTMKASSIPSNGDTQLFSLTGMGGLSQMTGHNAISRGYVWCSGILLQWGYETTAGGKLFPVTFPNNVFVVVPCGVIVGGTSATPNVYASAISTAGFTINLNGSGSSTGYNFNWFAIGN